MNIETTLTIPVEDVRVQAQQLCMNRETYDSGKVLETLLDAFVQVESLETEREELKEELETQRDEALEKLADAERKLKEVTGMVKALESAWSEAKATRRLAYDLLDTVPEHKATAEALLDVLSTVTGRVEELVWTLED